ncbi:atrial natriuretic peptide receptor 1, partial [Biomphalaria glabrata]
GSDTTETSAQQYILNGYYNCFLVYLTAVNDTLTHGGDIRDGQTFIKKIFNRTYLGKWTLCLQFCAVAWLLEVGCSNTL